jgi:glucose/mannose-6-phosphate isomerase
VPLWQFSHHGQPRAAVGFSFGLLLALFTRLGFIPDQAQAISEAVAAMRRQQEELRVESPVVKNLAKRLGGQLMERYVVVFGSGLMAPVARRWKGQINEVAKAWAQFEYLPEADHNTLAGIYYPEEALSRLVAIFLLADAEHPRNRLRTELTRKTLMLEGINTDSIRARGEGPLAQMWTALHLGDYTSYYLAMAYGVDPTPITSIEGFKREMSERSEE